MHAHAAGIHTYVAVAPVFPECGYQGMLDAFTAIKSANPCTIFVEPVNLHLRIAKRIQVEATKRGREIDMTLYTDRLAWSRYAITTLWDAERAAREAGVLDRLHLWPDHSALASKPVIKDQTNPTGYLNWLDTYWDRISEWPGKTA